MWKYYIIVYCRCGRSRRDVSKILIGKMFSQKTSDITPNTCQSMKIPICYTCEQILSHIVQSRITEWWFLPFLPEAAVPCLSRFTQESLSSLCVWRPTRRQQDVVRPAGLSAILQNRNNAGRKLGCRWLTCHLSQ